MARLPKARNYYRPLGVVVSDDGVFCECRWFNSDESQDDYTVYTNILSPRGALTVLYTEAVLNNYPHPMIEA